MQVTLKFSSIQRIYCILLMIGMNLLTYLFLFVLFLWIDSGRPKNGSELIWILLLVAVVSWAARLWAAKKEDWLGVTFVVDERRIIKEWPSGRRQEGSWIDLAEVSVPAPTGMGFWGRVYVFLLEMAWVPVPIVLRFTDNSKITIERVGLPIISQILIVQPLARAGPGDNLLLQSLPYLTRSKEGGEIRMPKWRYYMYGQVLPIAIVFIAYFENLIGTMPEERFKPALWLALALSLGILVLSFLGRRLRLNRLVHSFLARRIRLERKKKRAESAPQNGE